jgi:hypothetical protein
MLGAAAGGGQQGKDLLSLFGDVRLGGQCAAMVNFLPTN